MYLIEMQLCPFCSIGSICYQRYRSIGSTDMALITEPGNFEAGFTRYIDKGAGFVKLFVVILGYSGKCAFLSGDSLVFAGIGVFIEKKVFRGLL